ncbi:MAG: STAS domain-containing protein [Bacteroidia bacterium]|nr:STAS domain-containing protein [Bacteroidia bacterium]
MDFTYQKKEKYVVFQLSGRLIGEYDGMTLTETVANLIGEGFNQIIIDLTSLEHINSSGLGVLITLLTKARKTDGELILSNPSSNVSNLLTITKLNTIFRVYPNVEQAVASLSQ